MYYVYRPSITCTNHIENCVMYDDVYVCLSQDDDDADERRADDDDIDYFASRDEAG